MKFSEHSDSHGPEKPFSVPPQPQLLRESVAELAERLQPTLYVLKSRSAAQIMHELEFRPEDEHTPLAQLGGVQALRQLQLIDVYEPNERALASRLPKLEHELVYANTEQRDKRIQMLVGRSLAESGVRWRTLEQVASPDRNQAMHETWHHVVRPVPLSLPIQERLYRQRAELERRQLREGATPQLIEALSVLRELIGELPSVQEAKQRLASQAAHDLARRAKDEHLVNSHMARVQTVVGEFNDALSEHSTQPLLPVYVARVSPYYAADWQRKLQRDPIHLEDSLLDVSILETIPETAKAAQEHTSRVKHRVLEALQMIYNYPVYKAGEGHLFIPHPNEHEELNQVFDNTLKEISATLTPHQLRTAFRWALLREELDDIGRFQNPDEAVLRILALLPDPQDPRNADLIRGIEPLARLPALQRFESLTGQLEFFYPEGRQSLERIDQLNTNSPRDEIAAYIYLKRTFHLPLPEIPPKLTDLADRFQLLRDSLEGVETEEDREEIVTQLNEYQTLREPIDTAFRYFRDRITDYLRKRSSSRWIRRYGLDPGKLEPLNEIIGANAVDLLKLAYGSDPGIDDSHLTPRERGRERRRRRFEALRHLYRMSVAMEFHEQHYSDRALNRSERFRKPLWQGIDVAGKDITKWVLYGPTNDILSEVVADTEHEARALFGASERVRAALGSEGLGDARVEAKDSRLRYLRLRDGSLVPAEVHVRAQKSFEEALRKRFMGEYHPTDIFGRAIVLHLNPGDPLLERETREVALVHPSTGKVLERKSCTDHKVVFDLMETVKQNFQGQIDEGQLPFLGPGKWRVEVAKYTPTSDKGYVSEKSKSTGNPNLRFGKFVLCILKEDPAFYGGKQVFFKEEVIVYTASPDGASGLDNRRIKENDQKEYEESRNIKLPFAKDGNGYSEQPIMFHDYQGMIYGQASEF